MGEDRSIFFSYGHDRNAALVKRFKRDLESIEGHPFHVWIDYERIHEGDDWRETITRGILDSDVVLGFLSSHGLRDGGVCLNELAIAVGCHGDRIRTVCLEPGLDELIPLTVSGIQYLDLSDYQDALAQGDEAFEAWYQQKLGLIVDLVTDDDDERTAQLQLLSRSLSPSMASSKQNTELLKPYASRPWLAERISSWVDSDDSGQFLIVKGPIGSGKSSFFAHYSHFNPHVAAVIFCEWGCGNYSSARQIIKSIAYQMASKIATYRVRLAYVLENLPVSLEECSTRELFDVLFLHPTFADISSHAHMVICIDGLDEADSQGADEFVDVLASFAPRLPSMLRFVISVGKESHVQMYFSGCESVSLEAHPSETARDIADYLEGELGAVLSGHRAWERRKILDRLSKKCGGSFAYAELLAKTIRRDGAITERTEDLPAGLPGMYFELMRRCFPTDSDMDGCYEALCVIASMQVPIPFSILEKSLGVNRRALNRLVVDLGMFVKQSTDSFSEKTLHFFHRSFAEWVCSDAAGTYMVDADEGAAMLSRAMLASYRDGIMTRFEVENILDVLERQGMGAQLAMLSEDPEYLRSLVSLGREYEAQPNGCDRALGIYRRVLSLADVSKLDGHEKVVSSALCSIGRCQFSMGFYKASIATLESNLDRIRRDCPPRDVMQALSCLGSLADWKGRREESVAYFNDLVRLSRVVGDAHFEFQGNMGLVWNDHFTTLESALQRLSFLSVADLTEDERMTLRLSYARVYLSDGRLDKAIELYRECLSGFDYRRADSPYAFHKNRMLLMEALVAFYDGERFSDGIECGLKIMESIRNEGWLEEAYCATWLAHLYLQLGNFTVATEYLEQARSYNDSMSEVAHSDWIEMNIRSLEALLAFESGELETSDALYREVADRARACSDTWVRGDACFSLLLLHAVKPALCGCPEDESRLIAELKDLALSSGLVHLRGKAVLIEAHEHARRGERDLAEQTCQAARELTNDYDVASTDLVQMLHLERTTLEACGADARDATQRFEAAARALEDQARVYSSGEQLWSRTLLKRYRDEFETKS